MKRARKFLTLILIGMLPFMLSCGGGGGDGAPPPAFTTTDLQGTWNTHTLVSGDAPQWNGWEYGALTVDSSGNVTFGPVTNSDGVTETPTETATVSISPAGIISSPEKTSSSHGKMNLGKDMIVITMDYGKGRGYDLSIATKTGGTFTTSDLQGTWNIHVLTTGDAPQFTCWAYAQMNIDVNGNATFLSKLNSAGETTLPGPVTLSLNPDGIINGSNDPSKFHGKMNQSKDLVVATMNDGGGGYSLLILQKAGGTFSTADLQGNWWTHGLVSGDAPAQRIGWFYTNWSSDANGNFTALSHRDSTGLTTIPTGSTFSVSPSGVVTSASLPSFHGIMNQKKDMMVFTFTGYPGRDTGVGGYVLGIMLK